MTNRRNFLGAGAASALAMAPMMDAQNAGKPANAGKSTVKLGIASYSFREFSRNNAIRMTKMLGVEFLNIKEFHLLYRSTPEEMERGRKQFESAGLKIVGGGTISFHKEDDADIRFYFDYAKKAGMPLIVAAPTTRVLPMLEKFVKEYDIKIAVHNHGPEDKYFPSIRDALKLMKGMDPRMGVCCDIGHESRSGNDILESMEIAGPRLLDVHMKDLKDPMGKSSQVPVGDGVLPIVAIFKLFMKMNYQGYANLEYEIDGHDPYLGMARSFAYMRGVLAGLNG